RAAPCAEQLLRHACDALAPVDHRAEHVEAQGPDVLHTHGSAPAAGPAARRRGRPQSGASGPDHQKGASDAACVDPGLQNWLFCVKCSQAAGAQCSDDPARRSRRHRAGPRETVQSLRGPSGSSTRRAFVVRRALAAPARRRGRARPVTSRAMIRVLAVAGALLVIAQLHRAGGGVISSELHRTFGLAGTEIGVVIGTMLLASALAQVPIGLAFDRFGTRRAAAALALVALAGTLVFGSAGGSVGLALGRFLIGIGFGGVITVIMLLAMRWAPPERFATVAATTIASASLFGGLLGTAPLALALQRLGWTATFAGIALLTGLVAVLVLLVARDAP